MRCLSCDKILSNKESCLKSKTTGDYLQLCWKCLSYIREDVKLADSIDPEIPVSSEDAGMEGHFPDEDEDA